MKSLARGVVWSLASIMVLIGATGLIFLPDWSSAWRWVFTILWISALLVGLWSSSRRVRPWVVLGIGIVALAPYLAVHPRHDRDWAPDHARAPAIEFRDDGGSVVIRNFRAAAFHEGGRIDYAWAERIVQLDAVRTVDYVVEPFSAWRGLAHTFLTFGLADGHHVAISVEARREIDEEFSATRGLFRGFELIYVIGEERDLIGQRANVRRDPVHVYPIAAPPEVARALFLSMLQRAHQLESAPEFYHSYDNTCAAAVLRHVNEVRDRPIAGGWRVLFPGYSDRIAWAIGLTGFSGTLDEARARFRINARSAFDPAADDPAWSRQIRTLPK